MEAVTDETKSLKKVWLALAAVYVLTSINNGISYSYEKIHVIITLDISFTQLFFYTLHLCKQLRHQ